MIPLEDARTWINNKLLNWVNGAGLGASVMAWAADNVQLLINLLLFSIPAAAITVIRGWQKIRTEAKLNEIKIKRAEQELLQDAELHEKKVHADPH